MQLSCEKTIFMQKAIYYRTKLLAARGIIELTDRYLNFQVSTLDSRFGIRNLSIDICSIRDIRIKGGNIHPSIVVTSGDDSYEFVLSRANILYDKLKALQKDPVTDVRLKKPSPRRCDCGKWISPDYKYCPWCGSEK
ncbi:MAG: hypothetical protein GF417_07310 [Candidatus Latescibacteria bacterium]|nr:hypothetical protein [bacterium]MBD3424227.1 hypothetical protein [Candidatus Latescibacterota bacterium]